MVASSERFLRKIETLKAYDVTEDKGIGLLGSPISEHGIPIEAAIELLERDVVRPGANTASGGHLAYIPGGGIYHSALGDYLAAVSNKYAGRLLRRPGPGADGEHAGPLGGRPGGLSGERPAATSPPAAASPT